MDREGIWTEKEIYTEEEDSKKRDWKGQRLAAEGARMGISEDSDSTRIFSLFMCIMETSA